MSDEMNLREFTRVASKIEADVESASGVIRGQLRDVSMKGAFVTCSERWPIGTACTVTLYLGGRDSGVRARASGAVKRSVADGMGVLFDKILGTESYERLSNLILYNSPQLDPVEKEIKTHRGIKRRPKSS